MTTIVFNETNFAGLYAFAYCKKQGYWTVLLSDNPDRFRNWFPEDCLAMLDLVDQVIPVKNSNDPEEVKAALKNVKNIGAVMTFAEIRTRVTALICRELGLKGTSPEAVAIAQDKHRFRKVLCEAGADNVQSIRIDSIEQLLGMADSLRFPVFIKPLQGHSSIGSMVCRSASEIPGVVEALRKISEDWISSEFVVEDFLEGPLVSVEILTTGPGKHQIVGVADRDIVNGCVETGASFPLVNEHRDAVIRKACGALDAIRFDFGPSHVELIVTADGPHLVEVNTRPGGSGHTVMLDLSTSRSIVGDCVELALGKLPINGNLYGVQQGAAWKCSASTRAGTICRLPSREAIQANTGVREVWFHHNQGDQVGELDSNFAWIVQVMCTGKDQPDARLNAMRAIEFVERETQIV